MLYSSYLGSSYSNAAFNSIWIIVSAIIAIIGGILTYFLFLSKKNDGKFKGFWDGYMIFYHLEKCL